MEVWNGIWKKILVWNGIWKKVLVWNWRFLVWNGNGMEENCQYGLWKNRLPYHALPITTIRDILTRLTWRETTHPWNSGARDILTPKATDFCALLSFFFFFLFSFLRYAAATLFFSEWLTFGYWDVSILFSINCKLHRYLCFAETIQKQVVFSRKESW